MPRDEEYTIEQEVRDLEEAAEAASTPTEGNGDQAEPGPGLLDRLRDIRNWQSEYETWLVLAAFLGVVGIAAQVVWFVFTNLPEWSWYLLMLPFGLLVIEAAVALIHFRKELGEWWQGTAQPWLKARFSRAIHCPRCGISWPNPTEDGLCPECGERLRRKKVEPKDKNGFVCPECLKWLSCMPEGETCPFCGEPLTEAAQEQAEAMAAQPAKAEAAPVEETEPVAEEAMVEKGIQGGFCKDFNMLCRWAGRSCVSCDGKEPEPAEVEEYAPGLWQRARELVTDFVQRRAAATMSAEAPGAEPSQAPGFITAPELDEYWRRIALAVVESARYQLAMAIYRHVTSRFWCPTHKHQTLAAEKITVRREKGKLILEGVCPQPDCEKLLRKTVK